MTIFLIFWDTWSFFKLLTLTIINDRSAILFRFNKFAVFHDIQTFLKIRRPLKSVQNQLVLQKWAIFLCVLWSTFTKLINLNKSKQKNSLTLIIVKTPKQLNGEKWNKCRRSQHITRKLSDMDSHVASQPKCQFQVKKKSTSIEWKSL